MSTMVNTNFSVNTNKRTAYLFLILTTTIWGSLYVITRIALETVPPVTLLLGRYVIASLALLVMLRASGKMQHIQPADRKHFLVIGVLGYFVSVEAQILGTKFAGPSVAALINAMNPIFMTLFAVLLLKEKLTRSKATATLMALLGAYVILGGAHSLGTLWGSIFSILSVLLWSLSSVFIRRITQRYDALVVTAYAVFIATACALPAATIELLQTSHDQIFSLKNILCILYLGVICTAVPSLLWNKSLSLVEASTCSLFYPIQPLVSVLLGIVVLGETIGANFIAGALLIVSGILYAVLAARKNIQSK